MEISFGDGQIVQWAIVITAVVAGIIRGHWQVKEVNARCNRHKTEIERLKRVIYGHEVTINELRHEVAPDVEPPVDTQPIDWTNAPPY